MISERSFTIQGKIVKVAPITATSAGVQFGRILIQTDEIGQDGQPRTAHYAVECWGKSLESVYGKAKAGQIVKVQGYITATEKQTKEGKKFLNYGLRANFMTIDPASNVAASQPTPQYAPEPQQQYVPEHTTDNPLEIDPGDLPF